MSCAERGGKFDEQPAADLPCHEIDDEEMLRFVGN